MFTASVCTSSQLSAFSVKDFQYLLLTVTKENMTTSYSKNISVKAATSTGKSLPITKRLSYTDSLTWLLLLCWLKDWTRKRWTFASLHSVSSFSDLFVLFLKLPLLFAFTALWANANCSVKYPTVPCVLTRTCVTTGRSWSNRVLCFNWTSWVLHISTTFVLFSKVKSNRDMAALATAIRHHCPRTKPPGII